MFENVAISLVRIATISTVLLRSNISSSDKEPSNQFHALVQLPFGPSLRSILYRRAELLESLIKPFRSV